MDTKMEVAESASSQDTATQVERGGDGGPPIKRLRVGEKEAKTQFEENLLKMAVEDGAQSWERAPMPTIDPAVDGMVMQWVDIDMYTGNPLAANPDKSKKLPGSKNKPTPIVRLYGVTSAGNSVLFHVHGFTPYFYVAAPPGFTKEHCGKFREALEQRIASEGRRGERCNVHVLGVELETEKKTIYGYHLQDNQQYIKIYAAVPTLVPALRGIVDRGFECPGFGHRGYATFESNIPFVLRYMIDNDITGMNWLELKPATYTVRPKSQMVSHCQAEVDVVYSSVISHAPAGEWNKIAPLRILSFDIECMGRKGHFPEAEKDPVIQIANTVTVQGETVSKIRNVFVLDTCNPIVGTDISY
jgi:DNA polymerase delta subunit 1